MGLSEAYAKKPVPGKAEELPPFLKTELANIQRAIPVGLSVSSGAPNDTAGVDGNYYLRTDTPTTAMQRLYVKTSGAWVGIL